MLRIDVLWCSATQRLRELSEEFAGITLSRVVPTDSVRSSLPCSVPLARVSSTSTFRHNNNSSRHKSKETVCIRDDALDGHSPGTPLSVARTNSMQSDACGCFSPRP